MTYTVSGGTLNPTHSLSQSYYPSCSFLLHSTEVTEIVTKLFSVNTITLEPLHSADETFCEHVP